MCLVGSDPTPMARMMWLSDWLRPFHMLRCRAEGGTPPKVIYTEGVFSWAESDRRAPGTSQLAPTLHRGALCYVVLQRPAQWAGWPAPAHESRLKPVTCCSGWGVSRRDVVGGLKWGSQWCLLSLTFCFFPETPCLLLPPAGDDCLCTFPFSFTPYPYTYALEKVMSVQ